MKSFQHRAKFLVFHVALKLGGNTNDEFIFKNLVRNIATELLWRAAPKDYILLLYQQSGKNKIVLHHNSFHWRNIFCAESIQLPVMEHWYSKCRWLYGKTFCAVSHITSWHQTRKNTNLLLLFTALSFRELSISNLFDAKLIRYATTAPAAGKSALPTSPATYDKTRKQSQNMRRFKTSKFRWKNRWNIKKPDRKETSKLLWHVFNITDRLYGLNKLKTWTTSTRHTKSKGKSKQRCRTTTDNAASHTNLDLGSRTTSRRNGATNIQSTWTKAFSH